MIPSLHALLAPSLAERFTLLLNHVLASEPMAGQRLRAHAGRSVSLTLVDWPALLPQPPGLAWRVTPAGLLEWCGTGGGDPADLSVRIAAGNPALLAARALAGKPADVQIDGDAQLAGDVNWLMQNLRWDLAADLERLAGPLVAQQLQQLGRGIAAGLRVALQGVTRLAGRLRSHAT